MPRYEYRCAAGHLTEEVRAIADREADASCIACGAAAFVIFSPPHPANVHITPNFMSKYGCLTWHDFHDRSEKELAKDPNVERLSVMASQPGIGNTISQPGPELARKVKAARDKYPAASL